MDEFILRMNTEAGQESFKTDLIKGKLDGIIIDTTEKVEVIIESELGYIILQRNDHYGVKYYALRSITTTPVPDIIDSPTFVKFNLNESLIITVRGRRNQDVKLIFRFD